MVRDGNLDGKETDVREFNLTLVFQDEDFTELEEMAEDLECSVADVIVKCFLEGFTERYWFEDEMCEKIQIKYAKRNLEKLIS